MNRASRVLAAACLLLCLTVLIPSALADDERDAQFDAALAGLLSPALADEFSCAYVKKIVDAVQSDDFIVIYHNCGNAVNRMVNEVVSAGCAAYHFGNAVKMEEMMAQMPADIPAMGNVDPAGQFRGGTPESIREETLAIMNACCKYPNFVISSGCDIPPASKWENIDAFFKAVDEFYGR